MINLLAELAAKEKRHNLRHFSDDYRKADMWGQGEEGTPTGDYRVTAGDVTVHLNRVPCAWSEGSGGSGAWNMELIGFAIQCDGVLFAEFNVKDAFLNWAHHSTEAEQHLSEAINSLLDRIAAREAEAGERQKNEDAQSAHRAASETAAKAKHKAAVLDRFKVAA